MRQSPLLTFTSNLFVVEPGEDLETNPGIFGRSFARWLSTTLGSIGLSTGEVFAEDFGWCFTVDAGSRKTTVACASGSEAPTQWRVFVFAEDGLFARIRGGDRSSESVEEVHSSIHALLSAHPDVHDLFVESPDHDDA